MAYRQVVALLTQVRTRPNEQLVMVGTMRLMTVETTFANRRVFPEERSPLFGVTRVANLVHGIEVQKRAGRRAVRVVAVDAGHLAFGQRHVRTLAKLGALLLVTLETGLRDALPGLETGGRQLLHGIVAIGAGKITLRVRRSGPVQAIATLVAVQALTILHGHRRSPPPCEPDQLGLVECVLGVLRTRPVAGFTHLPLAVVLRIQSKDLRMQRVAEMRVFLSVTFDASRLADVLRWLRG